MKLRLKILTLVIGILVISLATLAVPIYWYTRTALEQEFDQRLVTVLRLANDSVDRELLSALAQEPALPQVRSDIEGQLRRYTRDGIQGIAIFASGNHLIARAGDPFPEMPLLPEMFSTETSTTNAPKEFVSEIFRVEKHHYAKYATLPLESQSNIPLVGVIWGEVQFMASFDQLKGSLFWITLVAIAVAIVLVILFSRNLIGPVERLAAYAKSIQKNLNTAPVTLNRKDELGDLNRALTEMHTELRENEQQNKQLLSGIAHEIKNPLGGLEIYTGLLQEELGAKNHHNEYFRNISQALKSLNQTVAAYLDYARPQKSELKILSVASVAQDVVKIIQPELDERQINFQMSGDGSVFGDESKLRRVILNLLKNAVEAVEPGNGEINLQIVEHNRQIEVLVQDNGKGISVEEMDTIFEPYYTTSEKGYGLGLPIAKNLLEEMNGTIFVQSEAEKGTTFRLTIPKAENDAKPID